MIHEIPSGVMPRGIGPYSMAVRAGDFVFVSAQVGLRPTGELAGADLVTEAQQAFENFSATLRTSGSSMERVVKVSVCATDEAAFKAVFDLFVTYFPYKPPALTGVIAGLPHGLSVSIDCVALA